MQWVREIVRQQFNFACSDDRNLPINGQVLVEIPEPKPNFRARKIEAVEGTRSYECQHIVYSSNHVELLHKRGLMFQADTVGRVRYVAIKFNGYFLDSYNFFLPLTAESVVAGQYEADE